MRMSWLNARRTINEKREREFFTVNVAYDTCKRALLPVRCMQYVGYYTNIWSQQQTRRQQQQQQQWKSVIRPIRSSSHIVYVYLHLAPPSGESRRQLRVLDSRQSVVSELSTSRRQAAESCASPLDGRVVATIV